LKPQAGSADLRISVEAFHCAAYAWNPSTIDGTDIICSVPALGQPSGFPLDVDLEMSPDGLSGDVRVNNLYEF
jgi:hypothetical protein